MLACWTGGLMQLNELLEEQDGAQENYFRRGRRLDFMLFHCCGKHVFGKGVHVLPTLKFSLVS